jgi:hypothetical protein
LASDPCSKEEYTLEVYKEEMGFPEEYPEEYQED